MSVSILIVDDSSIVRVSLRRVLDGLQGCEVCGEGSDGIEAIEMAQQLHPDLIILDLSMPRMNGLEAAMILKNLLPTARIILFTCYKEAFSPASFARFGISAVVSKGEPTGVLLSAVQASLGSGDPVLGYAPG